MMLFEHYVVSMFLVKREQEDNRMTLEEYLRRLEAMRPPLCECAAILSWEPPASVEGRRAATAEAYLRRLDDNLGRARAARASADAMAAAKTAASKGKSKR